METDEDEAAAREAAEVRMLPELSGYENNRTQGLDVSLDILYGSRASTGEEDHTYTKSPCYVLQRRNAA